MTGPVVITPERVRELLQAGENWAGVGELTGHAHLLAEAYLGSEESRATLISERDRLAHELRLLRKAMEQLFENFTQKAEEGKETALRFEEGSEAEVSQNAIASTYRDCALAVRLLLPPLSNDTPERSSNDTFEGFGGAGLTLEIPLDLAQVIVEIGDASPQFTEALTAEQHGRLMAENVRLTAERLGLPNKRKMYWVSVPGTLALAFTGTSPRSADVARALAGAWNLLRIHSQAALLKAKAAGDTPVATEPGDESP